MSTCSILGKDLSGRSLHMKEVWYVSCRTGRSDHSCGAFHSDGRDVHRTENAPRLLCLRTHSRREWIYPWSWELGHATDISQDPWGESGKFSAHAHLLSDMFNEGPEDNAAVLPEDRNGSITLLAAHRTPTPLSQSYTTSLATGRHRQTDDAIVLCQLRRLRGSRHPGQPREGPWVGHHTLPRQFLSE